ncbi:hypothetical protein N7466_004667 [Penicillium verhagenii]|uniref:uncharacterized protein n=1 Tax=Penicillium verhagenii TaxID=1562060 RepID=UPI0025455E22|nr:uncharacterized protein N7466_004667 [Penicillium verhagenii]KAJ5935120.1 hypothetical protein N7466_004667 [Penicillium verhagenii]
MGETSTAAKSTEGIPGLAPKRIIICCDGSGQSAVSGDESVPSNVTRLCRAINPVGYDKGDIHQERPWQQVVWYDSGIGTNSAGQVPVGKDLEGNIIEAYNFCVLNWSEGDQIMCFGFSRGAYTARAIAGLISDLGICKRADLQDFPEVWKLYKQSRPALTGEQFYGSDAYFDYHHGKPADPQPIKHMAPNDKIAWEYAGRGEWAVSPKSRQVEVVGVFETVGALGFPEVFGYEMPHWMSDKPEWHNVGLSPNIKNAFQALALDEHRAAFTPTLFYVPPVEKATLEDIELQEKKFKDADRAWSNIVSDNDKKRPTIENMKKALKRKNAAERGLLKLYDSQKERTNLLQVWFPGVHINIGGGSDLTLENKGNMEEMSSITFAWMLDQIKDYVSLNAATLEEDKDDHLKRLSAANDTLACYLKDVEKRKKESWTQWAMRGPQRVVSSLLYPLSLLTPAPKPKADYMNEPAFTWGLGDLPDNFSLKYYVNGSRARKPGCYAYDKHGKELGKTFEEIHPVVNYRVQNAKYHPIGLKGEDYKRLPKQGGGGYEYWFKYPGAKEYQVLAESKISDKEGSYEVEAMEGDDTAVKYASDQLNILIKTL